MMSATVVSLTAGKWRQEPTITASPMAMTSQRPDSTMRLVYTHGIVQSGVVFYEELTAF
jgi:hypothetical protein